MKYPHITPDDVILSSSGFVIEKITDRYDRDFPFTAFEIFLEELLGGLVDWSNIDDIGYLHVAFRVLPNIDREDVQKICDFINNLSLGRAL